ncbi:MAG: VanW family protein [Eubacteriales bacterium]|nr:VanW family protein [Eubacteriales bacterium]
MSRDKKRTKKQMLRQQYDVYPDDYGDDEDDEEYESPKKPYNPRKEARRERRRKVRVAFLVFLAIVIMVSAAVTAAGAYVTYSDTVYPNVSFGGILLGGVKKDMAADILETAGWDILASRPLTVTLLNTSDFEIDMCRSGAMPTKEEAAEMAFEYGRDGNWYANLLSYLKCLFVPAEVNSDSAQLSTEYIYAQIDEGIAELNRLSGEAGYTIDKENSVLRMVKGAGGFQFDKDAIASEISAALAEGKSSISYDLLSVDPEMPDFDAIHTELAREPQDAYFSDDNTFTVIDEVVGCEFDVSSAMSLWSDAAPAKEVIIPMTLTYPEITTELLESLLFRDVLGERTTYFPNSNDNRINNLCLASSKINDYVLYPGEVFSYNDIVGQRTEEGGFLPAGAYSSGEVVEEIGGGVCQVSSTLYCAMLSGYGLTTVERSPHYFPSDYIEKGYDATVSWPNPNFKFRNDTAYPIRISAECDVENRALTIRIYGTNIDGTYIVTRSTVLGYNNAKYPDLFEGYGAQVFRDVFDAYGNQIDMITEIYDVYHTHEFVDAYNAREAQAAAMGGEVAY